jgi:hypothetical protein
MGGREDRCFTLDPGRTALALRGVKLESQAYPFLRRILSRRRRIAGVLRIFGRKQTGVTIRRLDRAES